LARGALVLEMPRAPRLELPGVPLHIVQRGNNRAACFFGDIDRRLYLKLLAQTAARRGVALHAYVLMNNHVHILATPRETGAASAMMQDLGRQYVRTVNKAHARTGTLWEGRYRSSLVDSERYLLACHRYIELNPVRAGIVGHPRDYAWSSHTYYAHGGANEFITPHSLYLGLAATAEDRQRTFRALFVCEMESGLLTHIRAAVNTGAALGSRMFMERVAAQLRQPVRELRPGKTCFDPFRISEPMALL
jgi:putative transposase